MNTTHNFIDIFKMELDSTSNDKVKISKILIPKIQRPYAQGRKDQYSSNIRTQFIKEIFNALCNNQTIELNFIYGIIEQRGNDYVMQLIDGQQRLTTLFLLYWYIANQELNSPEDEEIREALKRFSYETRTTSTIFCQNLASTKIAIPEDSFPSQKIRESLWYFKSFNLDSTICGMLTMLDAIHEQYKECKKTDLHLVLHNIQFYFHSLGCYGLSEELYIKMNARGLQLTPFENFKAALINFITKSKYDNYDKLVDLHAGSGKIKFKDNFAIKIDSKWIDLFWQEDKDFDSAYLKFFTRYIACKYILSKHTIKDDEIRQDETLKALYTDIENSKNIPNNITFDTIENRLNEHPEFIIGLDKVLDIFYLKGRNTPNTNSLIYEQMLPIWDTSEGNKGDDFYCNIESRMTQIKLIAFSAATSFIETFNDFDETIFKEWMRVVWNIIENTNIDSLTPTSNLIRKLNEIIKHIRTQFKEGSSFYHALAEYPATNEGRAVVEEIKKAKLIAQNDNWLTIFKDAEKHPFFKGMVLFFYKDGMSIEDYTKAYLLVRDMFDEKGISPSYRKEHLLIRAIISHYNKWEWGNLRGRYITEDSGNHKYLKNILAEKDEVRNMFADIASVANKESEVKTKLNNYIEKATKAINDSSDNKYLTKAINTLLNNVSLYQWTSSINGTFRAWEYWGHIMLAVPNRWYDKTAIDTDSAKIAWSLSILYKLQFDDDNQFKTIRKYGICFGNEIWLKRTINNRILWVDLLLEHKVRISISCNTKEDANELLSKMDDFQIRHNDPKTIALESLEHFDYNETIKAINAELDRVIPILEQAKD